MIRTQPSNDGGTCSEPVPPEPPGKPGWIINPPPHGDCCEGCSRHVAELPAYGGPGDPLAGDFTGAKLVKRYRREMWIMPEADFNLWLQELREQFLPEEVALMVERYHADTTSVSPCWECRDCATLDDKTLHTRRNARHQTVPSDGLATSG